MTFSSFVLLLSRYLEPNSSFGTSSANSKAPVATENSENDESHPVSEE